MNMYRYIYIVIKRERLHDSKVVEFQQVIQLFNQMILEMERKLVKCHKIA